MVVTSNWLLVQVTTYGSSELRVTHHNFVYHVVYQSNNSPLTLHLHIILSFSSSPLNPSLVISILNSLNNLIHWHKSYRNSLHIFSTHPSMSTIQSEPIKSQESLVDQDHTIQPELLPKPALAPRPVHERTTPGQYLETWNEIYPRRGLIQPLPLTSRVVPPHPKSPPLVEEGHFPNVDTYLDIMSRMCPDNLQGMKCRIWADCTTSGRLFSCPDPSCRLGFRHKTHLHQMDCCKEAPNTPCNILGCYTKVDVYHIIESCKSLQHGLLYCVDDECTLGYNYPAERVAIHKYNKERG